MKVQVGLLYFLLFIIIIIGKKKKPKKPITCLKLISEKGKEKINTS